MHIGLYFQSNRNFIGIDSGLLTYLQNILYNLNGNVFVYE